MSCTGQVVWILGLGYLGRSLAAQCQAAGARVFTIDVSAAAGADMCADASHPDSIADALGVTGFPSAIFCCLATHGGTVPDYDNCYRRTAQTLSAAGLASLCVFCSSSSLYAGLSERSSVLAAAEQLILSAGGCVARLAPLYGPARCELLRRHLIGAPCLHGSPSRVLNYVHVEDAAAALRILAHARVSGVYAVCGESFTKKEAYSLLEQISGIPTAGTSSAPGRRCATSLPLDSTPLRTLGWVPSHSFASFVAQVSR